MSRREKLIQELISLIEDNDVAWRKAAFYSDPRVEPIYTRLLREWEEAGWEGIPLDYASTDELALLVSVAKEYAFMDEGKARALALGRSDQEAGGQQEEEKGRRGLFRFFRRRS